MGKKTNTILFIIYMACLLYLLTKRPSGSISKLLLYWPFENIPVDKFVHACLFVPMPIFLYNMLNNTSKLPRLLLPILFGVAIAVLTEVIQQFLPYRSFEVADILADSVGMCISVSIWGLIHIIFFRNKQDEKIYFTDNNGHNL